MPTTHLTDLYRCGFGMFTDLYQLTMAQGYWKSGIYSHDAVFHLFYRRPPFGGDRVMVAGLELTIELLQQFAFTSQDVRYLGSLKSKDGRALFELSFLNYLQRFRFRGRMDAMPEGTIAFPNEPILRIEAPLIEAQIIETALLCLVNYSSLIATKAARIAEASEGTLVVDFGFRRAHGLDGAITASRAAYIGGCDATSNVIAGQQYGIPVEGTHAHSWIMAFENELDAFHAYAEAFPANSVFLVDTYDSITGVRHAIQVGRKLRDRGYELAGIRLDSGDLATLSIEARRLLDEAGFQDAKIVASDNLDEYRISKLREDGARIDIWGVGTRLVTAFDEPALGGVYKLAGIRPPGGKWTYRVKRSEEAVKTTNPGALQVRRYFDEHGQPAGDELYNSHHPITEASGRDYRDLLVPVFRDGELVYAPPSLPHTRDEAGRQWSAFSDIRHGDAYPVRLSDDVAQLQARLVREAKYAARQA